MAQTIKLKRSATENAVPTTSQLELGEVAINTYDGKLYIKKDVAGSESIVEVGGLSSVTLGGLSDVTVSSVAADQLLQYNGSAWVNVSLAEASAIMKEYQFTATAGQSTFSGADDNSETLSYTAGAIQVFLNGIFLDSAVDYTATSGTSIVLTETVDANDYLQIVAFKKKIGDGNVSVDTFTGDDSTVAFTLSVDPGDENNTRVFIDGVYQSKSNYSVSGTTLTFSTAPPTGTAVEVEIGNRVVTLDTLSDLDLPDDVKLRLGTDQDLQIYHDGSNSFIQETGTGLLYVDATQLIVRNSAGTEDIAKFVENAAVQLYYDNGQKFATTSGGVTVTGTAAADGFTFDNYTLDSNKIATNQASGYNGDIFLDAAGDIILDADSGAWRFRDNGGSTLEISTGTGTSPTFYSPVSDADIVFKGNDGGSVITALTLDMSDAGTANFNNNISLSDSKIANFGDSADGQIYHDGSHFRLRAATGNFNVQANDFHLTDASNSAVSFLVDHDGATSLRYNQVQKLATTSTGIDVTGTVEADGGNFTGQVQFDGTTGIQLDNGAQVHTWTLTDNFTSRLNIGTSSASAAWIFGSNNQNYLTVSPSGVIINQDSNDTDFRVEGDTSQNLFVVDASTNRVNITKDSGTGTALEVRNNFNNVLRVIQDDTSLSNNTFAFEIDNSAQVSNLSSAGAMRVETYYGDSFKVDGMGRTLINDVGSSVGDFRVESDSNAHAIFVDAGNNHVNIGTSTDLGALLNVGGNLAINGADLNLLGNSGSGTDTKSIQIGHNRTGNGYSLLDFVSDTTYSDYGLRILRGNTGANAKSEITHRGTGKFIINASEGGNEIVLNEGSYDTDFRVESNGNTHAIFVNAGADGVGFGATASTVGSSTIEGMYYEIGGSLTVASNTETLQINRNGTGGNNRVNIGLYNNGTKRGEIGTYGAADGMFFYAGSTIDALRLTTGEAVFNEGSADLNFRVESNNNANMLFVDAGNDKVGFGNSSLTNTGLVQMHGTYAATNTADYRDNNVLTLTGNDPGTTADDSGINLAFVPVVGRGSAGVIAVENTGTNKEGGGQMRFFTGGGSYPTTLDEKMQLNHNNGVIFNETGGAIDFRVESNNRTHALFVDAGNDRLNIDAAVYHDSDTGNQKFFITRSGVGNQAGTMYTDDNTFVFDSIQDEASGANFLFRATNSSINNMSYLELDYAGGTTFNQGGESFQNFRVESDSNTHMLFVDAGSNEVGIGTGNPGATLDVAGGVRGQSLSVVSNSGYGTLEMSGPSGAFIDLKSPDSDDYDGRMITFGSGMTIDTASGSSLLLQAGGENRIQIDAGGEIVVNNNSLNRDFRVESDGNTHMLYVDAFSNRVGVGTNTPDSPFDVNSSTASATALVSTFRAGSDSDNNRANVFIGQDSNSRGLLIRAGREIQDRAITQFILNGSGGTIGSNIMNCLEFYESTGSSAFDVTVNQDGENVDFRIESNNQTHAVFVDAGNDNVLIGNSGQNTAFSEKVNVGLQIGKPGQDDNGGHMFMTQEAAQNTWKTICAAHDNGATGLLFLIHGVRTIDQNRSYAAMVRFAYQNAFNIMSVSSQNATVEYRVSGNNLQYRFTTAGTYIVNLTVMAAG